MAFPEHIFKSYDIRGLVEGELSNELAYRIGRAFVVFLEQKGTELSGKKLVVGYDMRPSSLGFCNELIRGMNDQGANVVNVGFVSTPMFNFACVNFDEHAGGIMVTASHNPAEYNGFKITLGNGLPVGKGSGMKELRDLVRDAEFVDAPAKGMVEEKNILDAYLARVFELVPKESVRPLKVVIDAGNGMAQASYPTLVAQLPIEVEYLFLEPDGTFPNHEANPLKIETLETLQKKVIEVGADFGFALDADCDRIGLVDEKGRVVEASFVVAMFGLEVLQSYPGSTLLYDLRSSKITDDIWKEHGAQTAKTKVGHSNIKAMMREHNARFAGELSLHLYFQDMNYLECSELAFMHILRLLSREQKPLSDIIKPLEVYAHSGEINFEVEDKDGIMKKIHDMYKGDAVEDLDLDGVWMSFDWGWFNVRKSNTEPLLRLNLEAKTKEVMEEKVKEVSGIIEAGV